MSGIPKTLLLLCISIHAALAAVEVEAHRLTKRDISWQPANWALGCDFRNDDLVSRRTSSDQCGGTCASTNGCTHFTWTSFDGGTCWMKQGPVQKSDAVSTNDQSIVCGIVNGGAGGINWQPGNWATGCDFRGGDLVSRLTSGAQCGGACASTSGCTHFTWTSFNGGTCWMKQGNVQLSDAIVTSDKSFVCGIVSGGGTSENGKTTRYWDCCKPSCSWPNKAPFLQPVNSCAKDGHILGPNDQNGCGGGTAYVCTNNQPWAINDNLAYGFAAAHLTGKSEWDTCCSCYELTFTSGPASGKKMVVQVVNTGADLGENHFDLQIPGGGVGIFNGCQSQWGAPPNGWGDRYGGVGSASDCSQLPSQLQAGCNFRFGWFRNSDNPTMSFVKVKCPAELISKSGCKRTDE